MRTCRECRERKPDYEFPRKKRGKMGIQHVCKKCKEPGEKQKNKHKQALRRNRLIDFRSRKRERLIDSKFLLVTVPEFLDQKINSHVFKFGYPSKSAFIRDAIDEQLSIHEKIFCKPPKKHIVHCGVTLSGQAFKELHNSTAVSNYSSISDFVRHAIKNQIEWDVKLWGL